MDDLEQIQPNTVWQHSNGNLYSILVVTNLHSQNPNYTPVVVYQGSSNGHIWSRPIEDWFRSFTLIEKH